MKHIEVIVKVRVLVDDKHHVPGAAAHIANKVEEVARNWATSSDRMFVDSEASFIETPT